MTMYLSRVFLNAIGKRVRNEFFVRLNQLEFGFDHAFDYGFDYAFDYGFKHCFKPSRF